MMFCALASVHKVGNILFSVPHYANRWLTTLLRSVVIKAGPYDQIDIGIICGFICIKLKSKNPLKMFAADFSRWLHPT